MYDDCARRAPPPPFEPSEPSRRRRVQWRSRIGGGERSEPITRMRIMPYDTESQSRNVLASPLGEEGHEVAKGVQANWIHRGAPRPANPVRRHPAKSVWTVVRMIMIFLFYVLLSPKGKTTHYILRVASAPSPSAVTDSLDFQVTDAPLQIQFT